MKIQLAFEFLKHVFVLGLEAKVIVPEEIELEHEREPEHEVVSIQQPAPAGFRKKEVAQ